MPSFIGEHRMGRHKKTRVKLCADCYPVAEGATEVVVADEVTAVIVHPDAVNPDGQVVVKPIKRRTKNLLDAIKAAEKVTPVYTAPEKTREAWLLEATEAMRPWFPETGYPLGEVRVSVGWPAGRSAKKNTIGQCFQGPLVADGIPAIFISPVLTDPVAVLSTLAHELAHAAVPPAAQAHRGPFVKVSKAIGLVAPWTATTAGEELQPKLAALAEELGPFGHAAVSKGGGGTRKVQDTRQLKVQCTDCECIVRMTRKWLDAVGAPTCGCGTAMQEVV